MSTAGIAQPGAAAHRPEAVSALDPISRAGEIIFGLIMVMTFTNSLSVAVAGRADVREMLVGALGCNLAWGIIDAVMYLMATRSERRIEARMLERIVAETNPAQARKAVAGMVPDVISEALGDDGLERVRQKLAGWRRPDNKGVWRRDLVAACWVFLLVFVFTLPVVVPFLLWTNVRWALAVSNVVGIGSLFLAGYKLGEASGQPRQVGLTTVTVGIVLVGIAKALGG
jgi:VIT1/CCC1 family predicted Fe2+/Mn2+ transporter